MELLPIFLNIRDRKCVIVGGGEVAFRKAALLARAGAAVTIQAETVSPELADLCEDNHFPVSLSAYTSECLKEATLVIAATDSDQVNAAISSDAKQLNIPVNVVDQPALCTFIVPSIVDRTPIVIAISSSGSSPVLIRKLKELNETLVPGNIGDLASLLKSYRKKVKQTFSSFDDRLRFWEQVVDSDVAEFVYSGQSEKAVKSLDAQLSAGLRNSEMGEVYLVGAGPGDPDLLTLKALRLMHKADVVLYDRLVSEEVLQKVRADATKRYVGKQRSSHSVEQEGINEMLVRLAKEGKRVLRLKGGDPFIFGRGGEELESLAKENIPFQVVPGITAASGCAAYAGIPLTHRGHAQSVRFLTGHLKNGILEMNWKELVREQETLVFYMGLLALPTICEKLVQHGMKADTNIALIEQGTKAEQRVLKGRLNTIVETAEGERYESPVLIIIGSVVGLSEELAWRS